MINTGFVSINISWKYPKQPDYLTDTETPAEEIYYTTHMVTNNWLNNNAQNHFKK